MYSAGKGEHYGKGGTLRERGNTLRERGGHMTGKGKQIVPST